MSAAVRNRSPARCPSDSPHRRHISPRRRRRISPRRERSPDHRRSSTIDKSPVRRSASHRSGSPGRQKLRDHARSSKETRGGSPCREKDRDSTRFSRRRKSRSPVEEKPAKRARSPIPMQSRSPTAWTDDSRSPSPRTRHPKVGDHTRGRSTKEKTREHFEDRNAPPEGKPTLSWEKDCGRTSKSVKLDRSVSPTGRKRPRRCSPPGSPSRSSRDRARGEVQNSKGAERPREYGDDSVSKMRAAEEALESKQKQKPSFELSGKLAEETNRVRGVTLLFTEPQDARKPDIRWRLYVFKAGEVLNEPLYLHRQSSYLFGRERKVADVPTDHPSCSKQHAVIQYRLVEKEQPGGLMKKEIRPYLMDLGSTNGTFINDNRIESQRYFELFEKDTIKFGNSSREYVLLHENSVH